MYLDYNEYLIVHTLLNLPDQANSRKLRSLISWWMHFGGLTSELQIFVVFKSLTSLEMLPHVCIYFNLLFRLSNT